MRPKQLALLWNVKILQKKKKDFATTKSYCQQTTPEALLCSWKLELEKFKMLQGFESDMKLFHFEKQKGFKITKSYFQQTMPQAPLLLRSWN